MWSPTHIQVTVQRAKGLLTKGKNGTNNCFVTIGLGKEKYQTSIKDKSPQNVDWHEECELTIPDRGNRAELVLTCLHRNNLGIDEFLGQVTLPLNEMDVYDRPRSKWFKLESKPGKEKKDKDRGELEVRIQFVVKSGSLTDLSKKEKHKSSIGQLASSVGGSLLSIGTIEKRKGLKKFAKSLGSKMHISGKSKKDKDIDAQSYTSSQASIGTPNSHEGLRRFGQTVGDADPGVISEDEDEFVFDNLSHKSSGSSLNIRGSTGNQHSQSSPVPQYSSPKEDVNLRSKTLPPLKPPRTPNDSPKVDEWEAKLYGKHLDISSSDSLKRRSWENSRVPLVTKEEVTENGVEHKEDVKQQQQPQKSIETLAVPTQKSSIKSAPSSPQLSNICETAELEDEAMKPKPLPRSQTSTSLVDKEELVAKESEKHHNEKTEKKRFREKLKYFRREKPDSLEESSPPKHVGERIIIGHENNFMKPKVQQPEISPAIIKKYEGKSREDLMLLANSLEGDVSIQKARVKELEDYLDNLLLRVMETHPKILQNPYTRTSSTKSG
ncbi:unnamed protein product [Hermetia illucens]|uniref:Rab11 family-interacting protein 1 n=1 Tax=Hermetia illucens TaxID=343691 RepID=A0A7R8V051_HERIL|nr:rab11 family-interacting protein 1 [Hermetia illucens]CAD7089781.1 unnamed protein product [Hermetia illucens]